jgi:MOSC domain-containing protein YiiM
VKQLTMEELEAGLDDIRRAPKDGGVLELIVRRPRKGEREVLEEGELDVRDGLVGDSWKDRRSSRSADGAAHPDMQINVMSSRVIALVAQDRARWQLAGDQLFVDMDLSADNMPPGTQVAIGSAVIEVTAEPHTGCSQFVERFGLDAMKFVNSPLGRHLGLRGLNARVVRPGVIRVGDVATKAQTPSRGREPLM